MMNLKKSRNVKDVVTLEEQVKCSDVDYQLNEKAAKAKLLKDAKRIALEVKTNSASTNLVLSSGSWKVAVLPAIKYWNQIEGDQTCKEEDSIIRVRGRQSCICTPSVVGKLMKISAILGRYWKIDA